MKSLIILLLFSYFSIHGVSQSRFGILMQGEYNRSQLIGNDNQFDFDKSTTKQRLSFGGKFGLIVQHQILKNLSFESQLGITFRTYSYKRNQSPFTQKNTTTFHWLAIEIPLNILIEFPNKSYTCKRYIGLGPLMSFNLYGIAKYKETGLPFHKNKISIEDNGWQKIDYGITLFVGFQDSENQNIRLGINFFEHGIYKSSSATLRNHQLFLSYAYIF